MIADVLLATSWGRIGPRALCPVNPSTAVPNAIRWANSHGVKSDIMTLQLYRTEADQIADRPLISYAFENRAEGWTVVKVERSTDEERGDLE